MTSKKVPPAAASLSWGRVIAWRLQRQHLVEPRSRRAVVDVAERICGLHAQLMTSAELTLWARVKDLKRTDVSKALWDRRDLVKLWAMRGTLHLLPSREFGMWQGALSTYDHYLRAYWLRYFDITRGGLEKMSAAIGEALSDRELTREELIAEVGRRTTSKAQAERLRSGWGTFLKPPSFQGRLCFAPSNGQNVRFTNPETWLGPYEKPDPEEARLDVVRRYLGAFGPASNADLARWWSGVTAPGARRLFEALGDDAVEVEVDGLRRWCLSSDVEDLAAAEVDKHVKLLPMFDQYVVASSRDAEAVLTDRYKPLVFRKSAWISAVVLVNGRIEGVWRHEIKGKHIVVTIEPFEKLPRWTGPKIAAEAESLARFFGKDLQLEKRTG